METLEPTAEHIGSPPGSVATAPGDAPYAPAGGPASTGPPTLGGAILRHPFLVIVPALLLVSAAIALGVTRGPTYSAETRLSVGRLDVSSQAIPGVVSANQSLAATYSRLVTAEGVVDPVAARVDLPSRRVASSLRASPIPESPIIRLEAHASNADLAVKMANFAGVVLTRYVAKINQAGNGDLLVGRFRDAATALAVAQLVRDAAQRKEAASLSDATRQALSAATAEYEVANIRFSTLRDQIIQDAQGNATTNTITTLNAATEAVSDHDSTLQRLVLIGLVAGLGLGILLALIRESYTQRAAPA